MEWIEELIEMHSLLCSSLGALHYFSSIVFVCLQSVVGCQTTAQCQHATPSLGQEKPNSLSANTDEMFNQWNENKLLTEEARFTLYLAQFLSFNFFCLVFCLFLFLFLFPFQVRLFLASGWCTALFFIGCVCMSESRWISTRPRITLHMLRYK